MCHPAPHSFLTQSARRGSPFSKGFLDFLSTLFPAPGPLSGLAPSLDDPASHQCGLQRDWVRRGQRQPASGPQSPCFQVTSRTPGRWDRRFREDWAAVQTLPALVLGPLSTCTLAHPIQMCGSWHRGTSGQPQSLGSILTALARGCPLARPGSVWGTSLVSNCTSMCW